MLKQTALYEEHKKLGGRLIDFGGWELPVQYTGVIDEHTACRSAAGLFDVSHMGEVDVIGHDAVEFLNYLLSNNIDTVAIGQAQYNLMCNDAGGVIDDLVIYKRAQDRFLVVVNASNTDKDFKHISTQATLFSKIGKDVKVSNESAKYSQIALQGRVAEKILQKTTDVNLSEIKTYCFKEGKVLNNIPAIIARTGYTGEDGFEIYLEWGKAPLLWCALLEIGQPLGLKPCGLGARDTLRVEMKYPLYGHEINDNTSPLEAGLGWVTKLGKPKFIGKDAIEKIKASGPKQKLIGLKLKGKGIPRQDYALYDASGKEKIGQLTSGTLSPSLKEAIGIGYVRSDLSAIGTALKVDIRGTLVDAEIVATPFYKRPY
mgnify:CR=1 FL=1